MTAEELKTVASVLGLALSHGAQCRGLTIAMPEVAEISRIAVAAQAEAALLEAKEKEKKPDA